MSEMQEQTWGLFANANAAKPEPAPKADMEWQLGAGMARVYLHNSKAGLQKPVILSDGFNSGPTDFDVLWDGLNRKRYAFLDNLRQRGHDVILMGYQERSASILENAEVATHCIFRAIGERRGDDPLTVGGFSMGGLVTRYALAKLEMQRMDHQTSTYLSFDSPHRGAWIPFSLQALAHFLKIVPAMSKQINSPAARQLLWRHMESVDSEPQEDPLRTEFLEALKRVGNWPMRPRKLAVANGPGTGAGNGVPSGVVALEVTKGTFKDTVLRTQTPSNVNIVAHLKGPQSEKDVRVRGFPELDGAPGGMLGSFGIAADNLTIAWAGSEAVSAHRDVCFVPSISAVSIRDIEAGNLTAKIDELDPDQSDFDEFFCSTEGNRMHTEMTPELGQWILERLPR